MGEQWLGRIRLPRVLPTPPPTPAKSCQADQACNAENERRRFGDMVRQLERHAGIIGKGEEVREFVAEARVRANAAGGELLNISIFICHVEIASAVDCYALGIAQAVRGGDCAVGTVAECGRKVSDQ